jgi:hypothetical protein
MSTFAQQFMDGKLAHPGKKLGGSFRTADGKTVDSTGAFLVGELERIDLTMHEPLAAVTWMRDIPLREDVTIADEVSSFTLSQYASAPSVGGGSAVGAGKSWMGKTTTQISGMGLDISKVIHPLTPWSEELAYSILELESAAKLGRPVDSQKFEGIRLKHNLDIDAQVYIGDAPTGATGLINNSLVTNLTNVANGASGFSQWLLKAPTEILNDVNTLLTSAWAASGYAVVPDRLGIPPTQFGYISTQPVTIAGSKSILTYLLENNIRAQAGLTPLKIYPMKFAVGAGVGGTLGTMGTVDRMIAYEFNKDRVRFPMTLLQRTPVQYDGLYHKSVYYCRLGQVEVVYPETLAYADGI